MEEIWKEITEYNSYAVSNLGRIKRIKKTSRNKANTILKPIIQRDGHASVRLYRQDEDGTYSRKQYGIHQLVMEYFVEPRPKGTFIKHLDGDKTNNKLENLEYRRAKERYQRKETTPIPQ